MSEMEEKEHLMGERRAFMARLSLGLNIVLAAVSIVGASVFWITLPEKIRSVTVQVADHEIRLRAQETRVSSIEGTLSRIDERTKAIQDALLDIRSSMKETKDDLRDSQRTTR